MSGFREEDRLRRVLYELRGVVAAAPGGGRLGPLDWVVVRGRRVGVSCAAPAQWQGLCDLLTGRRAPLSGRLEERETVTVQTDANLQEMLNLNQSISDYLNSTDAPEYVWLENRRRSLWVLIDLLGISPAMTRRPVKMESPALQRKYWALRFMVSRAELLLGREVFAIGDPAVQKALRSRWSDFPGALIACRGEGPLPGQTDAELTIDGEGGAALTGRGVRSGGAS